MYLENLQNKTIPCGLILQPFFRSHWSAGQSHLDKHSYPKYLGEQVALQFKPKVPSGHSRTVTDHLLVPYKWKFERE